MDLLKTEPIVTASLQVLRSIGKMLLAKQDPIAQEIINEEKNWPIKCPTTLQPRISTIQLIISYLKVKLGIHDKIIENGLS